MGRIAAVLAQILGGIGALILLLETFFRDGEPYRLAFGLLIFGLILAVQSKAEPKAP